MIALYEDFSLDDVSFVSDASAAPLQYHFVLRRADDQDEVVLADCRFHEFWQLVPRYGVPTVQDCFHAIPAESCREIADPGFVGFVVPRIGDECRGDAHGILALDRGHIHLYGFLPGHQILSPLKFSNDWRPTERFSGPDTHANIHFLFFRARAERPAKFPCNVDRKHFATYPEFRGNRDQSYGEGTTPTTRKPKSKLRFAGLM